MNDISIAVIGGDMRFVHLCNKLIDANYTIMTYGLHHKDLSEKIIKLSSLNTKEHFDYIIGPIPMTRDNKTVFAPLSLSPISLDSFLNIAGSSKLCLFSLKPSFKQRLENLNIDFVDLLESDEIAMLNAIPTAEGAIYYAMGCSDITLHQSNCLVTGFGRCSQILSHKLKGLQANVSITARKSSALATAKAYGYKTIPIDDLNSKLYLFDFIFNTIPSYIFDESKFKYFNPNLKYIELASMPWGVDPNICQTNNIDFVLAQSLPGKVAPKSAAEILYEGLRLILKKQEDTQHE